MADTGNEHPPGKQQKKQPALRIEKVAKRPPRRPKSLVMWSGGLDSTYTLVRLLKETDDEVFAHHVHRNARRDDGTDLAATCEYERQAATVMRTYMSEHYRPFTYSESSIDLTAFSAFARDTATSMFFAAQAAMTYQFSPFDRIMIGVNRDEDARWIENTETYKFRRMMVNQMLKAVWESEDVPFFYLWTPRPTKQAEADYLPLELFQLTASCRNPSREGARWIVCGTCAECSTLANVTHHEATDDSADRQELAATRAGAGKSLR
jgi:7-cyano-7-deazaguanine synthase in queuosine biosynthesis